MRIAHLLPAISRVNGGPPVSVVNLCRGLAGLGHESVIFSTDLASTPKAKRRSAGLESADLPPGTDEVQVSLHHAVTPLRFAFSPSLMATMCRRINEFDLLHIHGLFLFPQLAAWIAARFSGTPYVVSPRGALDPVLRPISSRKKALTDAVWQTRMLNSANAIHLTSEMERALILDLGYRPKHVVLPNAVDLETFSVPTPAHFDLRQLLGLSQDSKLILNHGRLAPKKRLDRLILAVSLLDSRLDSLNLVIVGADSDGIGRDLEELSDGLGIRSRVHLIGHRSPEFIAQCLRQSDVWALPSDSENFGLAVVEAMAGGIPTVVSDKVNIAAEAQEEAATLMVPNDPEIIADSFIQLLSDRSFWQQLAKNGKVFAQRYSIENVAHKYVEFYSDLIAGRIA